LSNFAARTDFGHHHFERRRAGLLVHADGNTDAVIGNRNIVIIHERDNDTVAAPGERFVNRVVHDFIYQMVERAGILTTDIHAGAQAYMLDPLQYLDIFFSIRSGN
jgi:hypothetical protein